MALSATIRRWLLPVSILAIAVVLVVVERTFGAVLALQGAYAGIGLLLASVIYYTGSDPPPVVGEILTDARLTKVTYTAAAAAIALAAFTNQRLLPLVVFLSVGYAALVLQLARRIDPRRVLPQIGVLFAVSPLTKYLTTGFYFGNTDIFDHVHSIERLLSYGTAHGIPSLYSAFPGLHILIGAMSSIAGLPVYDALLLTGVLLFTSFVPVVYLVARSAVANGQLAVTIALAFSLLAPVSFFSTYFYPQSLAFWLLAVLLLVALLEATSVADHLRYVALAVVLVGALTVVHHFIFILFLPILFLLLAVGPLVERLSFVPVSRAAVPEPSVLIFLTSLVAATTHWMFGGELFFRALFWTASGVVSEGATAGLTLDTVGLGTSVPEDTIATALLVLVSEHGIYYILLVAFSALGVLALFGKTDRFRRAPNFVLVGVLGAGLILKTPLSIKSLARIALPWTLFYAFVVGLGIHFVRRRLSDSRSRVVRSALVLVLVTAAVTAPLVAADDLTGSLLVPTTPAAHGFSEQEYAELESAGAFVTEYEPHLTTLWVNRLALRGMGAPVYGDATVNQTSVLSDAGVFMYRDSWSRYQVGVDAGGSSYLTWVHFSESWLAATKAAEHKVYSSGNVEMVWSPVAGPLGYRNSSSPPMSAFEQSV